MQITRKRKIEVRVTNTEKLILDKRAKTAGVTLSEYIRATAMNYDLSYKLTEDEITCYKQLTELKNNFQRIANFIKLRASKELFDEVKNAVNLVNKHLNKFS